MAISIILFGVMMYLLIGILFVFPFLGKGIKRIDEGSHGSSKGFFIIIIPGVIVFWPVLLSKWIKKK